MALKLLSVLAVSIGMAAAPAVAADHSPASKLSLAHARVGAAGGDSRLLGGSGGAIALVLAAGIAAIAIVGAVVGDDNDNPASA